MKKLTERQRDAYHIIKREIKKNGFSPTVTELAKFMGIYPNAAHGHVKALIKKGAITQQKGKMRSLQPVEGFIARINLVAGTK